MKKWFVIFCLLTFAIAASIYFLIPSHQNVNDKIFVNSTQSAVSRFIINKDEWLCWWPGKKIDDSSYCFKNYTYRIEKILLNGFETLVFNNGDSLRGFVQFAAYGQDSTQFKWISTKVFSARPGKRFVEYVKLKKIEKNIDSLLINMQKYFDRQENVYGMKIVLQKVTDTSLISERNTFSHYPTTVEIYKMIHSVKEYIQQKGGEESNYPMLNVHKEGPERYETMVAIPTKRNLPSEGKFQFKRMILGNILMGEVKGGVQTVVKGEEQLAYYVTDYNKMSPAISYQSLVTSRLSEPDSSKWVTRLYYPVFY
ncbi:MAG: hypothetical protein ABIR03_04555 [Ginsengibacter sp.]